MLIYKLTYEETKDFGAYVPIGRIESMIYLAYRKARIIPGFFQSGLPCPILLD
jgi:hypothetical protein